jgi:hypothetical protein
MANRFTRNEGDDDTERGGTVGTREVARERVTGDGAAGAAAAHDHGQGDTMRDVRARQKNEFGGFNWGSDFFGWLVAVGLGAILTGIVSAAGAVIGLNKASASDAQANADTIGIVGGVVLLLVLMVAYYCGGYVAGRMSRFDGARNGFGVWLIGLIITVILAAAAAILGAEYNVLQNINLPTIPVDGQSLSKGGIIATVAAVVLTILAAVVGGKAGERFHKKVDRTGFTH